MEHRYEQNISQNEQRIETQTVLGHSAEVNLITEGLNLFITAFNSMPSFKIGEDNHAEYVWLLMAMRAMHSLRCSKDLLLKGYYSQTLALARTMTEGWIICETVKSDQELCDYLFGGKGKPPIYSVLAGRHEHTKNVYEQDYKFQCDFSHASMRSLAALLESGEEPRIVGPTFDEDLFMACSEALARASLFWSNRLLQLLTYVNGEAGGTKWGQENNVTLEALGNWLKELPHKWQTRGQSAPNPG